MPDLVKYLELDRCPHCQVDQPSLIAQTTTQTSNHRGGNERHWKTYACVRCGGMVLASGANDGGPISEMFPAATEVHESVPDPANAYLQQAIDSLHAPAGSVMLSASAVDAMLKAKGLTEGTLYERINRAADEHLITADMAEWAHEVRLDANEPRHADEVKPIPSDADAKRAVDFSLALAEFLYVLPSKVQRGLSGTGEVADAG